jgi:hypothetical protein
MLKYFFGTAALLFALVAAVAIESNHESGVNAKQAAYVLNREVRAATMSCARTRSDSWSCSAEADPDSGSVATHAMRMRGADCWTAVRMEGQRYRRYAAGCIK